MTCKAFVHGTLIGVIFSCLLLSGCVTSGGTAKPNPVLAGKYIEKGQTLEKNGDLPAALEQYKLAMTADPNNSMAADHQKRLSTTLSKMANERYALGMKYYRQGKYGLARKEFLVALKYQPDHPKASKMLVSRQPDKSAKYFSHMVQKGESLSIIANKYYGDYKKFDVIARFNNITDATHVKPGQTLMIPDLPGASGSGAGTLPAVEKDKFVWHTIKPGQSISKVAQIYYGDYKQFHLIAQYNGMDDATRIKVGDRVKVPKVAGLPFTPPGDTAMAMPPAAQLPPVKPPAPMSIPDQEPPSAYAPTDMAPPEGTAEADAQIFAYRDTGIALYREGKYEDAIFELNKAVEAVPADGQTKDYLAKAYFESGKKLYRQNDFMAAKEAFESSLQFDPQCSDCADYIEKCKSGPLMAHRSNGIRYLNNNEFSQAIAAFNKFIQVKPSNKEVRTLLSKAYFQKALVDYNKGQFLIAKEGFGSSLAFDDQCEKCAAYIAQSDASFKEAHYNKGVGYYGKQQLHEAIVEWEQVYVIDPGYKDVEQNLARARELMKKLEKIKQSTKP